MSWRLHFMMLYCSKTPGRQTIQEYQWTSQIITVPVFYILMVYIISSDHVITCSFSCSGCIECASVAVCNVFASVFVCAHADGFRKVMHIDTGIVKQERDGPVEFQHPYFKQGQDDLLENIKRKVHHPSVIMVLLLTRIDIFKYSQSITIWDLHLFPFLIFYHILSYLVKNPL